MANRQDSTKSRQECGGLGTLSGTSMTSTAFPIHHGGYGSTCFERDPKKGYEHDGMAGGGRALTVEQQIKSHPKVTAKLLEGRRARETYLVVDVIVPQ